MSVCDMPKPVKMLRLYTLYALDNQGWWDR